jgi:hypothetical protein
MIVGGDVDTGMVEVVLFAMATRGADSEARQCAKRSRRCGVGNSMTPPTTVKTALHVRRGLEDIICLIIFECWRGGGVCEKECRI